MKNKILQIGKFSFQLRSRQADEYRNLEEDYRQRHQRLQDAHEKEIENCIRRYFAKGNFHINLSTSFSLLPSMKKNI